MAASPGGVEVGRVSVRVLPDTARFGADLDVALRRIEATTELKVNATIDNARLDAEARAAVDQAQLAAGDIHVNVDVDTSQVREAESAFASASSSATSFGSGLGGILSAVILLGPALIPLTAAVVGLGAALVAPLAIAGGGLTVFGFMAGFTIAETQKQLKAISAAGTKLAGLTKGTAAYTAAAADLKAKQAALTPAQVAYADALDKVKTTFDLIPKTLVLSPITAGLNLLARTLPAVTPILKVVSNVVSGIIDDLSKAAKSQGFQDFVTAFAKKLGPDLRAFAAIATNVFVGLFGLFGAFGDQLSGSVLSGLTNLTAAFANWGRTVGQSQGFKSFVDYVKRVGPQVAKALGAITLAAVSIAVAFAPIGGVVLAAITGLAQAINKIPTEVLVTLATAIVALVAASKILGPVQALFTALTVAPEIVAVVVAVAALTAGFIALYRNSKPLQQTISDLGDFFKTSLLPQIREAAQQILPALRAAFDDISASIKKNQPFLEEFGKALLIIGTAAVIAGIYQLAAAIRVLGKLVSAQITVWHALADSIIGMLRVVVGGLQLFLTAVLSTFGSIVDGAAAAFGWLPKIGPKVRAAQAQFHAFADNVVNDLAKTSAKLKALQDQIDGLHGKTITISVLAREQNIDRAVGPGGGIRRPGQDTSSSGGGSATGTSRSQVTINHATFTSTDDVLRKSQNVLRSRAGGGVVLAGGNR